VLDTKDDRLGVVVHELKTPIAIIKAYAELLELQTRRRADAAAIRELRDHILEQADLMARWVEGMLAIPAGDAADLPLELTRVDLVQLAWSRAEEFQQTTTRHQIRLVASARPPRPIMADRMRVRQALGNLLENAVKYATDGTVELRLGVLERVNGPPWALLSVHDQGPGLEPADVERIFRPFEQMVGVPRGGLGLGLPLARRIAQQHGGDLWVESRGRGRGSTFVLALPMT
jgi:signal transduction histidine kinase